MQSEPWALLVIDMQNDFVLPEARLCVRGALATVPTIAAAVDRFRRSGWPVIWVVREHAADGSDLERLRAEELQGDPVLVAGTAGAEIVAGLSPRSDEPRVVKKRWSAFMQTELDWLLRRRGVDRIAVSGTQIPNCLRATVFDAVSHDYRVALLTDACSAQSDEIAESNIRDIRNIGVVCLSLAEFGDRYLPA
jgi:nicotinamidase-related amidase